MSILAFGVLIQVANCELRVGWGWLALASLETYVAVHNGVKDIEAV